MLIEKYLVEDFREVCTFRWNNSNSGKINLIVKVQDLVNRTLWKVCTFSGDGEYICAGSAKQHQIYIWERTATQQTILKILEGTRGEQLLG